MVLLRFECIGDLNNVFHPVPIDYNTGNNAKIFVESSYFEFKSGGDATGVLNITSLNCLDNLSLEINNINNNLVNTTSKIIATIDGTKKQNYQSFYPLEYRSEMGVPVKGLYENKTFHIKFTNGLGEQIDNNVIEFYKVRFLVYIRDE
jgi:hypothetical protein